jgi:putative ABC transport system ATP-binding protein
MLRIGERLHHRPAELSGGQQQRVAIARALVAQPDVVFADEHTGNLDSRTGQEILGFLRSAVDDRGQSIVMVTHDPGAAAHADQVVFVVDGRIHDVITSPTADAVLGLMGKLGR